jgi:hypothetical protein
VPRTKEYTADEKGYDLCRITIQMQPRHGAVDRNLLTKLAPCRWHPFGLGLGANVLVGGSHRISAAAVGLRPGWCGPADATINGGLFRSIGAAVKANDPVS